MFNYTHLQETECNFYEIADISDILSRRKLIIQIDDLFIVIISIGDQIFALGDVCSHDEGPLGDGEVDDANIVCPRHGARFDIRTGKVKTLPAVVDIPAYPVRIRQNMVEVGIPKE